MALLLLKASLHRWKNTFKEPSVQDKVVRGSQLRKKMGKAGTWEEADKGGGLHISCGILQG